MEKPLEKVIAGTWDLKTAAEEIRKEKEAARASCRSSRRSSNRPSKTSDPKKILEAIDEIVGIRPDLEEQLGPMKLRP